MAYCQWKFGRVHATVSGLPITGANREVVDYWLSEWRSDIAPSWQRLRAKKLNHHLPAIAIFQTKRDESVTCRVAGTYFRIALGFELTTSDLMALTPERQRAERWANVSTILAGAIYFGCRKFVSADGSSQMVEEIALPFGDCPEDGSRHLLFHSNWQPQGEGWLAGRPKTTIDLIERTNFAPFSDEAEQLICTRETVRASASQPGSEIAT